MVLVTETRGIFKRACVRKQNLLNKRDLDFHIAWGLSVSKCSIPSKGPLKKKKKIEARWPPAMPTGKKPAAGNCGRWRGARARTDSGCDPTAPGRGRADGDPSEPGRAPPQRITAGGGRRPPGPLLPASAPGKGPPATRGSATPLRGPHRATEEGAASRTPTSYAPRPSPGPRRREGVLPSRRGHLRRLAGRSVWGKGAGTPSHPHTRWAAGPGARGMEGPGAAETGGWPARPEAGARAEDTCQNLGPGRRTASLGTLRGLRRLLASRSAAALPSQRPPANRERGRRGPISAQSRRRGRGQVARAAPPTLAGAFQLELPLHLPAAPPAFFQALLTLGGGPWQKPPPPRSLLASELIPFPLDAH